MFFLLECHCTCPLTMEFHHVHVGVFGCIRVFARCFFLQQLSFFQIHLCLAFMLHFSRGCLQMRHLWSVAQSHPLISWNAPKRLLWVTSWDNPGIEFGQLYPLFFWSWPAFDHHQTGKGFYMTSHHDIAKLVLGTSWYRNVGEARPAMFRLMELGALGGSALIAGSMFLFTSFVKARRTHGGVRVGWQIHADIHSNRYGQLPASIGFIFLKQTAWSAQLQNSKDSN